MTVGSWGYPSDDEGMEGFALGLSSSGDTYYSLSIIRHDRQGFPSGPISQGRFRKFSLGVRSALHFSESFTQVRGVRVLLHVV